MEPIVLHLGDWTIDESIERMIEVAIDNLKRQGMDANFLDAKAEFDHMRALAKQLLPLVLYLCTEEPEVEDRDVPDWMPHNPQPKKIRGEFRMMPAKNRITTCSDLRPVSHFARLEEKLSSIRQAER